MKDFKDKIVVITGAGSGMGRAYAMAFAKLGAKLALNDYDAKALDETVRLLPPGMAKRVTSLAFDVADKVAMYGFADQVSATLGKAHVVVNNAGIEGAVQPTWRTSEEDYERIMRINFFGVLHGTKAFLPQLLANREGAIVNVSSIFGLIGTPNSSDYCASKFAVRGFTEALMVELHDSPISVHLVHPGGIATNIARRPEGQAFAKQYLTTPPEDIVEYVIKGIRQKRVKIVYGRDAWRTWLGSNLLPQRWLNAIVSRELKRTYDPSAYNVLR
ncbi:MAG: SDR family oxidoreductase [Burkholderiales bacterium]|jgi:short-subunit dehydrogenase|nr:MAG: SDR family oxidoreductase [Burkholderiales bacterium]